MPFMIDPIPRHTKSMDQRGQPDQHQADHGDQDDDREHLIGSVRLSHAGHITAESLCAADPLGYDRADYGIGYRDLQAGKKVSDRIRQLDISEDLHPVRAHRAHEIDGVTVDG